MQLTEEENKRYSRHILLEEFGVLGQEKLKEKKVLIVGAGGLGSSVGLFLGASGVGTLSFIDYDFVDISNLQRQIAHKTKNIGKYKVDSINESIKEINPLVNVKMYKEKLSHFNAKVILKGYDFIVDATDNFISKFLIADTCYFHNIPYSHGGVLGFSGQVMTVIPKITACYRCVFNAPPSINSSLNSGVFGPMVGTIGTMQATEVIKYFLDIGSLIKNGILTYSSLNNNYRIIKINKQSNCPLCGDNPSIEN